MTPRTRIVLASFALLALAIACLRFVIGPGGVGLPDDELIARIRAVNIWNAALVGAALGVAGVLLQSLLRNPLAAPDLMGLSAGAGLGVTLATLGAGGALGVGASAPPALIGAIGALALVWVLSQRRGLIDPITMVLVGVILSVVLGAATMLAASRMPDRGFATARWMMGSLREDLTIPQLAAATLLTLGLIAWSVAGAHAYDACALGEDEARSVGVRLARVRISQLLGAGALTTVSIVLAGPIGFVGLVSPHLVRLLIGPAHRTLLIGSTLAGASLVLGADALSRTVRTDAGLVPIGVLTALVGGPVFLAMLVHERRAGTLGAS